MTDFIRLRAVWRAFFAISAFGLLTACAAAPEVSGVNDPLENTNRAVHAFNRGVDQVAVRPASQVYGNVVPGPIQLGIANFSSNLGLPSAIINNALQGDLESAALNTGRFLVNTTFGLGGILDPSTELGVPEREADFGQTLHVWGVGEGAYVELPLLGPSTTRDTAGTVVDFFLDPVGNVLDAREARYVRGAGIGSGLSARYRFTDTIDSVLYDSADSYAQARLIYLQNRRFELGQETTESGVDTQGDLYDDLYLE